MSPKVKVCLSLALCFVGILFFSSAFAQQSLPASGSSFETAVKLEPGTYQGGATAKWQELYYYVQVKAGQQLQPKLKFESGNWDVAIFDEGEEEITSGFGSDFSIDWLTNADKSLYKYYLKISSNEWKVDSFSLEISLVNYYDAGSQTDAGDDFNKALSIVPGDYESYLGGDYGLASWAGDDYKDYYKIPVEKGVTYEFKLIPPVEDAMDLKIFNLNRTLIKEESSQNAGAVVALSLTPAANTNIFLRAGRAQYTRVSNKIQNYQLNIKVSVPLVKFYTCEGATCKLAGEFTSLGNCQETTTKTCYQTTGCDGECEEGNGGGNGIVPPSSCQDECSLGQTKCFDNFNYHKCGNYDDDECLEWSTPVYCGEGNKCESGKCVQADDCQCSAWIDKECAGNGCQENEMYQIRICAPEDCDQVEQCLADATCKVIPPPIECLRDSDCQKGFMCQEGGCIFKGGIRGWWGWLFPAILGGKTITEDFLVLYLLFWLALYIYLALSLQVLAKKTNTPNGWLAWIPIANIFLMLQIAQKPLWWFVLILIPIVNIVIGILIWMKIAERRGKPSWVGILMIVPVIDIAVPGYLAFSNHEKIEPTPVYASTGTQEANKSTVGYKHPCKYCGKLIPPNSTVCPLCGKVNPLGPYRCPKCHEPVEKDWQVCSHCGQNLRIVCPKCGKITFFGDYCEDCGTRLLVTCPHCGQKQPPLSDKCIKCGKPLQK